MGPGGGIDGDDVFSPVLDFRESVLGTVLCSLMWPISKLLFF